MEYLFERSAMRGEDLPNGLNSADTFMYLALRNLYKAYKLGLIDRAQGTAEKTILEQVYRNLVFNERHIYDAVELFKRIESAACSVRKDTAAMDIPCVGSLMKAIYKL